MAFHRPRGEHLDEFLRQHHHDKHKSKLPVIPDLRFEYSFLRSISSYVQVERVRQGPEKHHSSVDELLRGYQKVELLSSEHGDVVAAEEHSTAIQVPSPREVIHVQWKKVLWVTTRDQVVSPLLQGALWAIASYFLTPYSAELGSKLGYIVRSKLPTKEGSGAGWLRKWVKGLGLTTTSQSVEETR